MEQYLVTGMTCAACQNRVEKAVSKVPGVTACSVSLLTNSMGVEGTAKPADIIRAVTEAGYGAEMKGAGKQKSGGLRLLRVHALCHERGPGAGRGHGCHGLHGRILL